MVFVTINVMAQNKSAIYLSFQPADFGLGVRCDYYIQRLGIYNSLTYGNGGLYKANQIKHHTKITIGILVPLPDYHGATFDITTGLNYHALGSIILNDSHVSPQIFNPWSFEIGLTTKWRRFSIGARTDILRWEPCIDFGIKFKKILK